MLKERNIAFFIDLYNTELNAEHYGNIMEQLCQMGDVISGTIYGATERTHKDVLADADLKGYTVVRTARKRGRKNFDNRIIVDVVDKVCNSRGIDTVCIVALPADMVYLYAYLRERGVKVVALNNGDDASMALVDEIVDSGKVETLKLPKTPRAKKAVVDQPVEQPVVETPVEQPAEVVETAPVEEVAEPVEQIAETPVVEQSVEETPTDVNSEVSRMDELLKEIDRLRAEVEAAQDAVEQQAETPVEQPVDENAETPVEETPLETAEESPAEQPVDEVLEVPAEQPAGDTPVEQAPVEEVAEDQPTEDQVAETPTEQPTEEVAETPAKPRATYSPQDDADLIRKIEQMRQTASSDEELIDEIKKLLDDID